MIAPGVITSFPLCSIAPSYSAIAGRPPVFILGECYGLAVLVQIGISLALGFVAIGVVQLLSGTSKVVLVSG